MWGGFPKVVREVFPNAKLVVDRFHVMQALIKELNTIRKQTRVTEKGARFLILKNKVDLKESEKEKLERILKCSSRLRQAYKLKEDFREIYESQLTIEEGAERFKRWLRKARKIYGDVIGTIRNHLPEIGSPGIVVETVFGDTFRFSPNLAIPGFQGLVTFAINMIPGEPRNLQLL
jgi:transposase